MLLKCQTSRINQNTFKYSECGKLNMIKKYTVLTCTEIPVVWETGHCQNHVVSNFQLWKAPLVAVFKIYLLNMDNFLCLLTNSVIRGNTLRVSWIAMNYQCYLVVEKCWKILLVSLHSIFCCHLLYGDLKAI